MGHDWDALPEQCHNYVSDGLVKLCTGKTPQGEF